MAGFVFIRYILYSISGHNKGIKIFEMVIAEEMMGEKMKTLYFGGTILTMEKDIYTEAVLTENTRILAVGGKQELEHGNPDCEKVDLQGKVMLPGFVDAHSHFTQTAMGGLQVSLGDVSTIEEAKQRIQEFSKDTSIKRGEWIIARDYDDNLSARNQRIPLAVLNELAPENPLVIQYKSGHMGLFNRLALEKLQITGSTTVPEGGRIEQDVNGLTGYMEENAFFKYLKMVPTPSKEKLTAAYNRAQDKYVSYGITTIQEGMFTKEMLPLYQFLLSQNLLKLDLNAYTDLETYDIARGTLADYMRKYHHHVKFAGIKIFLDGSPQGRTAWMREPYHGSSSYSGYGTMTDEEVCRAFELAGIEKIQLLAHCNGDAAVEQFLRCLKKVSKKYQNLLKLRPVIIHGQLMGRDQLREAKELGAVVSFFAAHTYYWGDVHVKNFGLKRASRISPAASAKRCGLPFTFHQDAPVINPDMLETIWCAVNRITKSGIHLGVDERVSVFDALKAVTINAAYQYFEEGTKGSIAPGKYADFVILDKDPLSVPKEAIRKIHVLKTIKNGREVI